MKMTSTVEMMTSSLPNHSCSGQGSELASIELFILNIRVYTRTWRCTALMYSCSIQHLCTLYSCYQCQLEGGCVHSLCLEIVQTVFLFISNFSSFYNRFVNLITQSFGIKEIMSRSGLIKVQGELCFLYSLPVHIPNLGVLITNNCIAVLQQDQFWTV